ncbi:MAG TPA: hypothetical protein VGD07_08360 [Methylomirabilota bacterium]
MTLAVRKLRIEDVEKLQALVVENFDAIEPGLIVLDARLLLGHSTIDVIGVDAAGSLVLGAIGFTADEEMLLKAVETYSWCLEYSASLVRHYPSCRVSEERPPRLLFVVERVPDAFHRKIKQLGFPEVDCVEFRHLEFDGVAAVYFETLLRLRRGAIHRAGGLEAPPRATASDPRGNNGTAAVHGTTATLQTVSDQGGGEAPRANERQVALREPTSVGTVSRRADATSRIEMPRLAPEPLALAEPEPPVPGRALAEIPAGARPAESASAATMPSLPSLESGPVTLNALPEISPWPVAPSAVEAEPRVSFKDLASTILGAESASPMSEKAMAVGASAIEAVVTPVELARDPMAVAPAEVEATPATPAEARPAEPRPALTVEALAAGAAPVAAPVSQQQVMADAAKQLATALPQEFEGLKFPNDGVLTRQWMEFLNQMSASK